MTTTYPVAKDITSGLQAAINRAASTAHWYRSKAGGRRYSGDVTTADRYSARSKAYEKSLSRLEECAGRLGLFSHGCTSGMNCYHA